MFGTVGKSVSKVLAYKNNDQNNQGEDNEEESELEPLGYLGRLLLFPVAVPVFMFYIAFYARGKPIASELDEIDDVSDDSDSDDDSEISVDKNTWKYAMRTARRFFTCQKEDELKIDPYAISYENFLHRQQLKSQQKKNIAPYKISTDVARTDLVKFPHDGVFIKNIFVKLSDTETLKKMLEEIEEEALMLQSEFVQDDSEVDDWSSSSIRKGEAQRVLKELILEAERGKAMIQKGESPYKSQKRPDRDSPGKNNNGGLGLSVAVPGSPESQTISPFKPEARKGNTAINSKGSVGITTPFTKSKPKPKKEPTPDHVPLADRMSAAATASIIVDGPTMDHV